MTISQFFRKLYHRLWSTKESLLLVRPANTLLPEQSGKACPGEFRAVTEENIHDCAQFEDVSHYVPVYRAMLERGDLVRFGYLDGKCVFRHAMQRSGMFLVDGCPVRTLGPNEGYIHYVLCAPPSRGLGFHTAGTQKLCTDFFDYTLYSCVKPDNRASLHGFFSSGFQVYSLLTVKNRLFHRKLTEHILTSKEVQQYLL